MAITTSKANQRPSKRGPYTPKPKQLRVLERHRKGESNRKIASHECLDRCTVGRILTQGEVLQMIAEGQSRLVGLIPDSIAAFKEILGSDDLRAKGKIGTDVLKSCHVLRIEVAQPEVNPRERLESQYVQIVAMAVAKSMKYGTKLPQDVAERLEEVERSMAEKKA